VAVVGAVTIVRPLHSHQPALPADTSMADSTAPSPTTAQTSSASSDSSSTNSRTGALKSRHHHFATAPAIVAPPVWRVAWGSAMAWGYGHASNVTVRDMATLGVGGEAVRVRISNVFGTERLVIAEASVGLAASGASVVPGTLRPLTFGGASGTTVAAGRVVYSDPIRMKVSDRQTLAISVYASGNELVTVHPCCTRIVSYFTPNGGGNLTMSVSGVGLRVASPWERWVDAVDVLQATGEGSIAVVGDSITEGYNTTLRWTDVLQERIDRLPPRERRAVVNEGITANALTSVVRTDEETGGGPSGLSRAARDALTQAGVSELVLFLGTNDLWFGATADQVIQGYKRVIAEAHQADIRIVGVTLLPRSASREERWTPLQQRYLHQVNQWILTSGAFDGVLNLATTVSDIYGGACEPTAMFPPFDSGDHLHPDAAGQTAIADAVDASVLKLPRLPRVPPLLAVRPTTGCKGAKGIPAAKTDVGG
jgi:lysophospholipase L1-like esterase